jgi:hypothetical protein
VRGRHLYLVLHVGVDVALVQQHRRALGTPAAGRRVQGTVTCRHDDDDHHDYHGHRHLWMIVIVIILIILIITSVIAGASV